ncbi:hypothetical protein FPZ43_16585 [Mucilaginibacter pallidiroseus]|uniref:Glycosyl transferase family 28 C-terminal domain-containing protein n=1 Tax=Mucilaginibacter pallidiroseus TaxID=2599295 RepID=A0A563U3H1_9SPHI|nr:glycosyltransferase [Mucilaginibacter pallidiroseus]TWR25896.1 hypothetical protein FPZ43_16585 [Mucilaginibacter pallidiroseus]
MKPAIFYFVHAHGNGHRATFNMFYPALSAYFNVIAITTNSDITNYLRSKHEVEVMQLPPKYPDSYNIPEHTFSKPFEVTPYAIEPANRAKALADAIIQYQPKTFYCDGLPELAIIVRGMGVPVVLIHLPGNIMNDPTQVFAHQLADHIIAHFPEKLEQDDYQFGSKTFYSGYLSQYSGRDLPNVECNEVNNVTVLLGYDNYDEQVLKNITADYSTTFTIIGNKRTYNLAANCKQLGRVADISKAISGDIVISAAGQNTIAELLSLNKHLILLPEPRPYNEQEVHAKVLAKNNIALLAHEDFSATQWQDVLSEAKNFKPSNIGMVQKSAPETIAKRLKDWYA